MRMSTGIMRLRTQHILNAQITVVNIAAKQKTKKTKQEKQKQKKKKERVK